MVQVDATAQTKPKAAPGAALTILICFLVAVLEGFDIQAIGLVAPRLAAQAGLGPEQLGAVFSMANVGLVLGAMFGGWLADKWGRKPVFMIAVAIFGAFTWATAYATDYNSLLVVRVLVGFGLGAALPNIMAIAAETGRPDRRASTATMMFCGMPVGGACSAIFMANLPAHYDWRLIFYIGGILPLVLVGVIWLGMRETRSAAAGEAAKTMSTAKALFGEGRTPATLLLWLTFFPTLMILYMLLNWLPSLMAAKDLSRPLEFFVGPLKVGMNASFTFNLASVFGALLLGQIIDRIGFRWPTIVCFVGLLGGLMGLARATEMPPALAFAGVAGFFILGAQYALYGVATSFYPAAARGIGSGAVTAAGRVGAIVGPWAAGELLKFGLTAEQTIMAMAPAAVLAGVAVFLLSFQKPAAD